MNLDEAWEVVSGPCPLCGAWQVQVAYTDADSWFEVGELVEAAIAEHVDDDLARFAAADAAAR